MAAAGRVKQLRIVHDAILTNPTYPNCLINGRSMYDERIMSMPDAIGTAATTAAVDPGMRGVRGESGQYFFFIFNMENYFHFLYDTLPYLWWFRKLKTKGMRPKLLLAKGHNWLPFQRETFQLLGIEESDICYAAEGLAYETLYVPTSFTHGHTADCSSASNNPPEAEAFEIWAALAAAAAALSPTPVAAAPQPKKLYISRRSHIHGDMSNIGTNYTTRRRCLNEDAVVATLAEHGYTEIFCETLTMSEKIALFSGATHVIGFIGGGMANLLFSPTSTLVGCIETPEFLTINGRFVHSMGHTRIQYLSLTELAPHEGPWPLYIRVRLPSGAVGEIEAWAGEGTYTVKVPTRVVAGFALGGSYDTVAVHAHELVPIDHGLNSPFVCDAEGLRKYLHSLQ